MIREMNWVPGRRIARLPRSLQPMALAVRNLPLLFHGDATHTESELAPILFT
jgi:hypothetical protein